MNSQNLMAGKKGLIMGIANEMSIAWAIAKILAEQGAKLTFTYQGDALKKRVIPLAQKAGADIVLPCDVEDEKSMDHLFDEIAKKWDGIDFVLHSLAWAEKKNLKGRFLEVGKDDFLRSMSISCYSLIDISRRALPLMKKGGSILTMSYYGAEKVMPHYNVMGVAKASLEATVRYLAADLGADDIRVNAISAGPLKTLAASAIGDFRYIFKWNQYNSPLRRNITQDDVAGAGLYLLSNLSSGVTGEIHHVDGGYHVVGMKNVDAPDISIV